MRMTILLRLLVVYLSTEVGSATMINRKVPRRLANNDTIAPTRSSSLSTSAPTLSPSKTSSQKPYLSLQPTKSTVTTLRPTKESIVTKSPTTFPTVYPSAKPSIMPTKAPHHESWLTFLLKFVGWLIFIGLSGVLFGMCMSYRYHLYYFLLQSWYIIRRSSLWRRLRHCFFWRSRSSNPSSTDEILFDQGDPLEGLLLRQRDS